MWMSEGESEKKKGKKSDIMNQDCADA